MKQNNGEKLWEILVSQGFFCAGLYWLLDEWNFFNISYFNTLGFTFLNHNGTWTVRPTNEKKKLKQKLSEYLKRGKAIARPLVVTINRVNQIVAYLNRKYKCGFTHKDIFKVANSRLGWYKRSGMNVVNFIISPNVLENKMKDGAGLPNPLSYYLSKVVI